ncbi:helix-turn-helix domain-containing protein [Algoriphagus sp. AGSA1]|uniref:helix-turn-helix domain-containing protein n=1 Tax=Algoriphagus sp. AGSA1 TaxID=2907213 RepID=UPI001F3BB606|nr:helix-turn-helix domain-containing protein [Algoriphagus sp. AGSA1]MCE7056878.1 helix-turn-helix domain-containing protein [Algoriphagus sp. AGSA1]
MMKQFRERKLSVPTTPTEFNTFITQWGEKLLTPKQAAEFMGYEENTLAAWRCRQTQNLPYIKIGNGGIRYRRWDLLQWLNSKLIR